MRSRWALLVVLLLPARLFAQAEDSVDEHLLRGVAHRQERRDDLAREEFLRALELRPSPEVLAQLGLAEAALGRWVDADAHLRAALAAENDPFITSARPHLEDGLAVVTRHLGTIRIEVNADGAVVVADGLPLGSASPGAPLVVRLAEGRSYLTLRAPDRRPTARFVDVTAEHESTETFLLAPARDLAAARRRWLRASLALGISGAVLWAGAGVAQGLAASWSSTWNTSPSCLAGLRTREENCGSLRLAAENAEALALAGWVAGGAAVLGGGLAWMLAPRGGEELAARCAPAWGGITCALRF